VQSGRILTEPHPPPPRVRAARPPAPWALFCGHFSFPYFVVKLHFDGFTPPALGSSSSTPSSPPLPVPLTPGIRTHQRSTQSNLASWRALLAGPFAWCRAFSPRLRSRQLLRSAPFRVASGFALLALVAAPPLHHPSGSAPLCGRCCRTPWVFGHAVARGRGGLRLCVSTPAGAYHPPRLTDHVLFTPHPPGTLTPCSCALSVGGLQVQKIRYLIY